MTFLSNVRGPALTLAFVAAAALGAMALGNAARARRAERENPPLGDFIDVDGVRLHYLEDGEGEPLVLLHGNGSMIEDFEASGLIAGAARDYRVIAFDRPGFGHSERPRGVAWTAAAQAELIHHALTRLGVGRAIVLGHSWGALVAVEMALRFPRQVSALVLVSGYHYPTARADVPALAGPAVPVLGDVISHTLAPYLGRALWPVIMRKLFAPAPQPQKFRSFPREMALRPSQVRAAAEEAGAMIPAARTACHHYAELDMPVVIVAGVEDRVIDFRRQSARLHGDISGSVLRAAPQAGHMVHQTATQEVLAAIREADALSLRALADAD